MKRILTFLLSIFISSTAFSQDQKYRGKFEPIDNMIPQPNVYRSASGAPGKAYWQQRASHTYGYN